MAQIQLSAHEVVPGASKMLGKPVGQKKGRGVQNSGRLLKERARDMVSRRQKEKIVKKQLVLREQLWPGMEPYLWDRHRHDGFTTMPKTMPIILRIMDEMTKGKPVSSTYLSLWCSTWDRDAFVSLAKPGELAYLSGFGGERAIHTWITRMNQLHALRFIVIKPGKSGPLGYALILNPHLALRHHHEQKTKGLIAASYNALVELALEVGARDMTDPLPDEKSADEGIATPDAASQSCDQPVQATGNLSLVA